MLPIIVMILPDPLLGIDFSLNLRRYCRRANLHSDSVSFRYA